MGNNFEFQRMSEIIPKRYQAVLPLWDDLLRSLDIEITDEGISEINMMASNATNEEEAVKFLYEMFQKVKQIRDVNQQREYIRSHQFIRGALLKAHFKSNDY